MAVELPISGTMRIKHKIQLFIFNEGEKMKVKILQAMIEKRLEKDVTVFYFSVMISYEDA